MSETPIGPGEGRSPKHDRTWGLIGGGLGAAVGLGSAAIAVFVEGADAYRSSPYPPFFTTRHLLVYDAFLAGVMLVGAGLVTLGLITTRRGRFPRTDGVGASGVGLVLLVLGAAILFTRLIAVVSG